MTADTKIEWADSTFNPWIGCTKISAACDNCYAADQAARFKMADWGPHAPRKRTSTKNWLEPLKWNRQADAFEAKHGRPRFVFCASMADVFDNAVDPQWRSDLFDTIAHCKRLIWLILTKRPQNIAKMLPRNWRDGWPHVWLGTTVENQAAAAKNVEPLLAAPAAKRFLSCEPLLGPLNLDHIPHLPLVRYPDGQADGMWYSALRGWGHPKTGAKIDWVIAGGESGRNARPMHPDWARGLRDQCESAGVPFFFKQWGDWFPAELDDVGYGLMVYPDIEHDLDADKWEFARRKFRRFEDHTGMVRVGRAMAGRKLDGVEHDGRPFVPPKIKLPQPAFKTGLIGDVT